MGDLRQARPAYLDVKAVVNGCVATVIRGALTGDTEMVRLASIALRCYVADVVCDERGVPAEAMIDWSNLVDLPMA